MWAVVLWWLVLEGLGLLSLPLAFVLFSAPAAHGYPFAKLITLLLLTYVSWLAGYVIPMPVALPGTLALLAGLNVALAWHQRAATGAWLRGGGLQTIVRFDIVWTAGFLFFAWQRALNPEIFQQEKYMDFAFFNSLARAAGMPPEDPWMAGEAINYYYFGYLMFADLARLIALPPAVSYNLCVATIGGLTFAHATAVARHLTQRWGFALLGGATCILLGNLDGFLQLLTRGTLRQMDFWRSTRVLGGDSTINEFPFFSTIHGDLHPHFMVLPVTLVLLGILLDERLLPRSTGDPPPRWRAAAAFLLVSFVFGAMVATSTWELPVGAMVIALLAGRWQPFSPLFAAARLRLVLWVAGVVAMARYVLFLPATLGVQLPLGGVGVRLAETKLGEFLTINGFLLFPPALVVLARVRPLLPTSAEWRQFLAAAGILLLILAAFAGNAVFPLLVVLLAGTLLVAYAGDRPEDRAALLLVAAGIAALLACEIVYIRDAYGERLYRMNTVFKLYFQAWILLSAALPWCVLATVDEAVVHPLFARVARVGTAALALGALCYPLGLTLDRLGRHPTLDGNAYLGQPEFRDDLAAIAWLRREVRGTPVVLEATGNPYSYFARFASNTGLPTVLGWANHEGLWRGHDHGVGVRQGHVTRMYSAPTLAEVEPLLAQYRVRYVVVGALERQHYPARGLEKFAALPVAFQSGGTTLYEIRN
jgi:YYY domain-containing protein